MSLHGRERLLRIKELFTLAAAESSPEKRSALLDAECRGDATMRAEVEQLLSLDGSPNLLLDHAAVAAAQFAHTPRYRTGTVLAGRYRLTAFLASGGMGEVYSAEDLAANRPVAVKCIHRFSGLDGKAAARLRREVTLAAGIQHRNVCATFGMEEHEGEKFCVMELIPGETLAAILLREERLPPERALPLVLQILDGLEAAHRSGVVHRDLKPANIMLDGQRAVIIDFGLAGAVVGNEPASQSLTVSGAVLGTLAYAAPEQLEGADCGPQADLYSLGVIVFEMLTGTKPHEARSPFQLAAQKANQSIVARALERSGIGPVWTEAISRSLRANARERVQTAAQVKAILERSKPSLAFRLSPYRWPLRAAAAALVLALAGLTAYRIARLDYSPSPQAAALYEKGEAAMLGASPISATKLLEQAVEADGKFVLARAALAAAYAEIDQPDKARDAVLKASDASDARWVLGFTERNALNAARAVVVRKFGQAADLYGKIGLNTRGATRSHALLAQARMQELNSQHAKARNTVEAVLREDPGNSTARVRLAALLCHNREYDKADVEFRQAEKAYEAAGNVEGLTELLLVRHSLSRDQPPEEEAKTIARIEALASRTGNRFHALTAQFRRASAELRRREYDRAIAIMSNTSSEAMKEGMPVLAARAMGELGYGFLYQKKPVESARILREALAMAQRAGSQAAEANIRMQLAEAVGYPVPTRESVAIMQPAVQWFRQNANAETLPLILIKWGTALNGVRTSEAITAFEEALEHAVKNDNPMFQAMALQRLGTLWVSRDLRQAARYWDRGLLLASKTHLTQAYFNAAATYLKLGDWARAIDAIEQGERDVRENYRPGVNRDDFTRRALWGRSEYAYYRGDCDEALRLARQLTPPDEFLLREVRSCASGITPPQRKQDLVWFEQRLAALPDHKYFDIARGAGSGALAAVAGRDWAAAKRLAHKGIQAAVADAMPVFELSCQLALRAAHRTLKETAEAEAATRRVLELSAKVGYHPPDQFGGREDLLRVWRVGNSPP